MNGLYEISNLGRVKSLDKQIKIYNGGKYLKKGRILIPMKNKQGYLRVHLLKEGKAETLLVHRLVANAFIPNPNNYTQINHKNECKDCNIVENLEWCTHKYNNNYGNHSENISKALSKKICQFDLNGNLVKVWRGLRTAERHLNIANQSISLCCLGKRKTAGGYKWRFYNEKVF